jgi:hypothetical protein
MEIKIFYNGEELKKEASDPNRINEIMNEVRDGFPSVVQNIEMISFLKDNKYDGE